MMDAGRRKVHAAASAPVDYVQGNCRSDLLSGEHLRCGHGGYGIRNVTRMEQGFSGDVPGPQAGREDDVSRVL